MAQVQVECARDPNLDFPGGVAERSNAPDLKSGRPVRVSGVRIPPPPCFFFLARLPPLGSDENSMASPIRVMCVDDNDFVAEAIRRKLSLDTAFEWAGWLPEARDLVTKVKEAKADVVLLDIDMPGKDSFEALGELAAACPSARVIMLSGYVRADYIDRAVEAGAWGYVSKNENTETILAAIQQVSRGGFAMGSEVEAELRRRRT